jgi:hypothetical protein
MRRVIVDATRRPGPGAWRVPALALAAIAALAVALWLLPRRETTPEVVPSTLPSETVADSLLDGGEDAPVPEGPITIAPGAASPGPRTGGHPEPAPSADRASPPEERTARTVRFTAPNGTRIVWVLDPNLDI